MSQLLGSKTYVTSDGSVPITGAQTFNVAPVLPSTGSGYINLGGIKICWGTSTGGGSGGTTVTFPAGVSFTSAPAVTITLTSNSAGIAVGVTPTTTNFTWYSYTSTTGGGTSYSMNWIAIGV